MTMRQAVIIDVAVVRAPTPRKCAACDKRRIVFALSVTMGLLGNPDAPYKCAPCWGLR